MEKEFIKHAKTLFTQYTDDVIGGLDKELTVDQSNRIRALAENPFDMVKPELKMLFGRMGALTDKYMAIPDNVSVEDAGGAKESNTLEMNMLERDMRDQLAELDEQHVQQQIMIDALQQENDYYDNVLLPQADVDMQLCDLFAQNLAVGEAAADEHALSAAMTTLAEEPTKERVNRMRRSLH